MLYRSEAPYGCMPSLKFAHRRISSTHSTGTIVCLKQATIGFDCCLSKKVLGDAVVDRFILLRGLLHYSGVLEGTFGPTLLRAGKTMKLYRNIDFFLVLSFIFTLANGKYLLVELNGEEETEESLKKPCSPFTGGDCSESTVISGRG